MIENKIISIFTPCYNEEGNVYNMYAAIKNVMELLPTYDYEHVFIDNCSQDNTPEILRNIAADDKRVKVIFNVRNFGPSRSGSYGFYQTTGDASICLACDFQDPPELIPQFIEMWEKGYKVVWGKKEGSGENGFLYLMRKIYYKISSIFADVPQHEDVTGFGLYDREVMDHLRATGDPNPYFRIMIADFGYEVGFVSYHQPKRKSGRSSYNLIRYMMLAISSIANTSKAPLRLASFLGVIISCICFIVALYYLVMKLIFWYSFDMGFAPIVIGVFFLGGIQLLVLGIIGEYIGEILTRVTKRPMVVERERLNFKD